VNNTYILSRTVSQLSRSYRAYCKIIAFDKGVTLVNAPVLVNLFEHRHDKSYIAKN